MNVEPSLKTREESLIGLISPIIAPLGFEVVHVEVQNQRQKILRLFIDRTESTESLGSIGIQDCVTVTRALDEPLDQLGEIEAIFKGPYELEVSSPGIDRPLRTERDYERFTGREVRIHTFRPLTADEAGNVAYQERNPKQKNFLGMLQGIDRSSGETIKLKLFIPKGPKEVTSPKKPKGKSAKPAASPPNGDEVSIPLNLVSKANLEPHLEGLEK
jgi:ribosome maturation factor RimP